MIERVELAKAISTRLHATFVDLEETVRMVATEAPDDLQNYRQAIGKVCGALVLDVMAPIYKDHPEIMPENWK
jgi:hypothetical protein